MLELVFRITHCVSEKKTPCSYFNYNFVDPKPISDSFRHSYTVIKLKHCVCSISHQICVYTLMIPCKTGDQIGLISHWKTSNSNKNSEAN